MPEIVLTNVTKRWGKFYGVENLDLTIADNSFITLLGPSGCGKTTTLRMIAGLETPTSGRITIGDMVVFDSDLGINVPANKRKVGFLFQNYALWPNMTVYQNISFGLSNVKEAMAKVAEDGRCAAQLLSVLETPEELYPLLAEYTDQNGKVDEAGATVKLIDKFILSQYTAKALLDYKITPEKDLSPLKLDLAAKVQSAHQSAASAGCALDEDFQYVKGGQVVTEVRKMSREEIDLTVRRVSRIVKIGMFMDRYPAELSGGQQQRVAIARTLAPEPSVLFMDEPLSNLDAKLRLEMRYELQRLHVESGSTFVYVTHDQMEAMTLATQICLIENGLLQQYDAPLTVYNHPNNLFVADFVGNPSINFVDATGQQEGDGSIALSLFDDCKAKFTPVSGVDLKSWCRDRDQAKADAQALADHRAAQKGYVEKSNKDEPFLYPISKAVYDDLSDRDPSKITDGDFVLGIRPEFVEICDDSPLVGEVYGAMPTGMESTVKIRIGDFLLTSVVFGSTLFKIGEKVHIRFGGNNIVLFDRKSQRYIATGTLTL